MQGHTMRELRDEELDIVGGVRAPQSTQGCGGGVPGLGRSGNETIVREILEIIGLLSGNEQCAPRDAKLY
jgi:hypothetical protein